MTVALFANYGGHQKPILDIRQVNAAEHSGVKVVLSCYIGVLDQESVSRTRGILL